MSTKTMLTWTDVSIKSAKVARKIFEDILAGHVITNGRIVCAYPVPNGGIPAALTIQGAFEKIQDRKMMIVEDPSEADIVLDDILDSGATRKKFDQFPFYTLVDKQSGPDKDKGWFVFPWERAIKDEGPEDNIRRILQYIGEDPNREGLLDTPKRVAKSYKELFGGYKENPEDLLTVFADGACDEQVILRNIEFVSFCEHHMLPFIGTATVAYIPDGKVIGVSKLVRLLEVFTRRLQIQERLCQQVTEALQEHLQPKGAACIISAKHLCMVCRGVRKQQSEMITSSLTGVYRTDPTSRSELMSLVGSL